MPKYCIASMTYYETILTYFWEVILFGFIGNMLSNCDAYGQFSYET